MKKMIAAMVAAWAALGAFGVATHLPLDTRTGTRYARAEEPIAFDTAWGENVTQLVLNVDGTNALTATTATNGVYVWRPDFSSSRDVTLKLTLRGAVDAALTATFTTSSSSSSPNSITVLNSLKGSLSCGQYSSSLYSPIPSSTSGMTVNWIVSS